MARNSPRPTPGSHQTLQPQRTTCPACRRTMWADYTNYRTVLGLSGSVRLTLRIRRCHNPDCDRFHKPYRPEAEGRLALPQHEFGLDVIALVAALRYAEHRSIPEIHRRLSDAGLAICERTVTNLLDRYDELLAVSLGDDRWLRKLVCKQGRVVLAIDGMQPDVGHEVLWVLRDCLSGEVLLARSLLSSREAELVELIAAVRERLGVPIESVISDGQTSIRNAVAKALPDVPHQLCRFHYLREAARPIYEADRHAKKELKKRVRGIRPIEREALAQKSPEASIVLDYCSAVRSAITDDGRPPLDASGLKLHFRLTSVARSLDKVALKRGSRSRSMR
jgi:hypothetical protein